MKKNVFMMVMLLITLVVACQKDKTETYTLSGVVQKGPYLAGTTITVYELKANLSQTGRSFSTSIEDNNGTFHLSGVELASPYVEVVANGFYFNEVSGKNSEAQLTLNAIADVRSSSQINVNILTHLERERLRTLVAEGNTFDQAKATAGQEVLSAIGLPSTEMATAETLDLTRPNNANACLLAASVILQGGNSTASLTELLSTISTDLRDNGILNNGNNSAAIAEGRSVVHVEQIRQNMEQKYGSTIEADFTTLAQYIENAGGSTSGLRYSYPDTQNNSVNILAFADGAVIETGKYCMSVNLRNNEKLKIVLKGNNGMVWFYAPFDNIGWMVSDFENTTQSFTTTISNSTLYVPMDFSQIGPLQIEFYEDGATSPTMVKNINVGPANYNFSEPEQGQYGVNMLTWSGNYYTSTSEYVSFEVELSDNMENEVTYNIEANKGTWSIDPAKVKNWEYTVTEVIGEGGYAVEQIVLHCKGKGITATLEVKLWETGAWLIKGLDEHHNRYFSWKSGK